VTLSIDVTNSGERSGSEVVQVYVRDKVASQVRPLQELKAFQRVTLTRRDNTADLHVAGRYVQLHPPRW
jgi:beta-glucosidase